MAVQELFDKGRRKKMQDALKNGDTEALLRRQKPAEEPHYSLQLGKVEELPVAMKIEISGIGFRYMGIEGGSAVVRIERGNDIDGELVRIKPGKRKGISVENGNGPQNFMFYAKEDRDVSGLMAVSVTVTEILGE